MDYLINIKGNCTKEELIEGLTGIIKLIENSDGHTAIYVNDEPK